MKQAYPPPQILGMLTNLHTRLGHLRTLAGQIRDARAELAGIRQAGQEDRTSLLTEQISRLEARYLKQEAEMLRKLAHAEAVLAGQRR